MSERSDICKILEFPVEILINIILNLNARERVALGATCKALKALVFNEQKLLRILDFSEDGFLTTSSDVEKYFRDGTNLKHVIKLNTSNMYCPNPEKLLQDIRKATNLVQVNITGFKFKDFKEFGQFLEPLTQLKKLSSDWPSGQKKHSPYNKYLAGPFGRLTHLSLTLYDAQDQWTVIYSLELCRQLEELRLLEAYQYPEPRKGNTFWMQPLNEINKLRLAICYGVETGAFETIIVSNLMTDHDRWTRSTPHEQDQTRYFYFEKDLEVCGELIENVPIRHDSFNLNMRGWYIWQHRLLWEVKNISKEIGQRECCFLSEHGFGKTSMRIEDAKLLLKNPRHQITYLNLLHNIEPDCDVYLITKLFPKLNRLVLSNLVRYEDATLEKEQPLETGIKRKHTVSEKLSETQNSAFKKLVDNTPSIEELTLSASVILGIQEWDLTALYLIGGWKNLRTLWLINVPLTDGEVLVEIGKQCKNLEKLRLENLGPRNAFCYKEGLVKMLQHCHNLKDFSIQQDIVDKVSEIFEALADVPKLRRVRVEHSKKKRNVGNLIPSVEKLIRSCDLILFICEINGMTEIACNNLNSTLKGLKEELKRPNFQFEVLWWKGAKEPIRNFALDFAHKDLILSQRFTDAIFRLDLC